MIEVLSPVSRRFLEIAAAGRPRPAIDDAVALTSRGMTFDHLITDVLAPVLREVGRLWQLNRWTTAQEHAATAVIDGVLGAIGLQTPTPSADAKGAVLVACVEGEYHSVAARMGVERLRSAAWDVTFLGANVPAQDLQSYVAQTTPDAIVLSCTLGLNLPGAARCIGALADLGVPVIVAGAAFGRTATRAGRLGASAWIGPDSDATEVLRTTSDPARQPVPTDRESAQLEMECNGLVETCMTHMVAAMPVLADYTARQLAHTRADLTYILRHLMLTIDLDEASFFDDFVSWLTVVLTSRHVPATVLPLSLGIVADVVQLAGLRRAEAVCRSSLIGLPRG